MPARPRSRAARGTGLPRTRRAEPEVPDLAPDDQVELPAPLRRSLLAGCDATQIEAITARALTLCIVAGAGAGKTRVLTRRIAWRIARGDATAGHVVALTFTRKAAGELRGRLAGLAVPDRVTAGTFHGIALAQLRQLAVDRGRPPPVILDSKAQLLARLAGGASGMRRPARAAGGGRFDAGRRSLCGEVAGEIEWAKARLVPPEDYRRQASAAGRRVSLDPSEVAGLYERYEAERRRQGLIDFEDLLTGVADRMDADADFAAAQRWRFRHFFVDEFQDLNPAQLRLLETWLGGRADLCVVGDPDQAIYAWNGADPAIMTTIEARWPAIETVRLGTNYRSTPQVIALGTAALGGPGAGPEAPPRAGRADGPVPTVTTYATDAEEVTRVIAAVRRAHAPGRTWSQIAVLARTNAQLVAFEEACSVAGIPHRVGGSTSFLQRPGVKEAMARIAEQHSPEAFGRIVADLDEAAGLGPGDGAGDGASEDDRDRAMDLAALTRLCGEFRELDPGGGGRAFVVWARSTLRGEPSPAGADGVELATFHRAKGLEWPVVFVTGLERGLVPISGALDAEAQAEERRLLYVALTRAEEELHCSWARERRWGSGVSRREPSPWLGAIEAARDALVELGGPGAARRARAAAIVAGREAVHAGGHPPADPGPRRDLAASLRKWRSAAARAANVPPYVVMTDVTLEAIAERSPCSLEELLAVPGIGRSRATTYGDRLLALVRDSHPATPPADA